MKINSNENPVKKDPGKILDLVDLSFRIILWPHLPSINLNRKRGIKNPGKHFQNIVGGFINQNPSKPG